MPTGSRVVGFRRLEDRRGLARLLSGRRFYEVLMDDGTTQRASFGELDRLLDGRRYPADFWERVASADVARDRLGLDEKPEMTEWPNENPETG